METGATQSVEPKILPFRLPTSRTDANAVLGKFAMEEVKKVDALTPRIQLQKARYLAAKSSSNVRGLMSRPC